jgi:hypothetical protein
MMLDSPHTSVPMLMRGNTPPTTRSPPHQSRPTGNPPNRQPATVGEEERGGRGPTSRRTSMRAAPDCKAPLTARHEPTPRTSTSHPPQQQDAVHSVLRPGTGKGASAGAGPPHRATRPAAGSYRGPPPPPPAPLTQSHTTRSPANNNRMQKGRMSCHQQPVPPLRHAAKMSPRIWAI